MPTAFIKVSPDTDNCNFYNLETAAGKKFCVEVRSNRITVFKPHSSGAHRFPKGRTFQANDPQAALLKAIEGPNAYKDPGTRAALRALLSKLM